MSQTNDIENNLTYVAGVVRESENGVGVPSTYFLWAVIILVGFSISDFNPRFTGKFWMIAGPLGGVISGYLGWKHSKKVGQIHGKELQLNLIHWGAMLISIFMASSLINLGLINGRGLGAVTLLIVAISYIFAGNYLDRTFLWLGILMLLAFYPLINSVQYTWTITGIAVSAGLFIAGFKALRYEKP